MPLTNQRKILHGENQATLLDRRFTIDLENNTKLCSINQKKMDELRHKYNRIERWLKYDDDKKLKLKLNELKFMIGLTDKERAERADYIRRNLVNIVAEEKEHLIELKREIQALA